MKGTAVPFRVQGKTLPLLLGSNSGFVFTFLNPRVLTAAFPDMLRGFLLTLELAAVVVLAGLLAGFLLAVLRLLGWRAITWPIVFVVDLLRAVPPLVLIVLLFFGLPTVGVEFSGFVATAVALSAVLAAFSEEIFWAAIRAVPAGQTEVARALGLRPAPVLLLVVMPQALRIAVPPLTNRTIAIVKGTAFGSVVGVAEILGAAQSSMSFSGNPSPLLLGAAAYVVLFTPFVAAARWFERRLALPLG